MAYPALTPAPLMRVLVADDDPVTTGMLAAVLRRWHLDVMTASDGAEAWTHLQHTPPPMAILDWEMPAISGPDLCQRVRRDPALAHMHIILLTSRDARSDVVAGLDAGADDYLTKPFSVGELLARIRAAVRRSSHTPEGNQTFFAGPIVVDLSARRVERSGVAVHLTPIEYRLLAILIKHAGKVLTHRHLLKEVWGPSHVDDSHYLRIYMAQLRRKLEEDPTRPRYLITEPGIGYRIEPL
jgi:two-component system, OmpR family, KDP operon response regulator KdpE